MKQVILNKPEEFKLKNVDIPHPKSNEVIIKVERVGICGSDIHTYYDRHPFITLPIVLGHEFAGEIFSLGSEVTSLKVSDRVSVDPTLTCGECFNCTHGSPNICNNLELIGCHQTGAFAEYVSVPVENVLPIPDDVSFEEVVLAEPLAVGVHACKKGRVKKNSTVCIVGAGTIGLMTAFAAKRLGAKKIVLLDIDEKKCDRAEQFGFKALVNKNVEPKEMLYDLFGESGPSTIFECVGIQDTAKFCIEGAAKGGRIVIAGVFENDITVPMSFVQDKELKILGALTYLREEFIDSLKWIGEGLIDTDSFITHTYPIEKVSEAFKLIESSSTGNVVIDPSI